MSRTMELVSHKVPTFDLDYQQEQGSGAHYMSGFFSIQLVFASNCIQLHHIIKIILFTLAVLCIFCLMVWHAV